MAVFGLFSRRDKHKSSQETSSKTSVDASVSDDNDRASTSAQPSRKGHSVYGGPLGASSSKLMLGIGGKKNKPSHQTDHNGYLQPPPSIIPKPRLSSSRSESGHDLLAIPPSRSELFAAYGEPNLSLSTRSLPTTTSQPGGSRPDLDNTSRMSSTPDIKKPKGMFAWAQRERKKSKPYQLDIPSNPDESFSLKSFRHVSPASPSPAELPLRPPSSLSTSGLAPPARPRGNSVASTDSSQRISVAAFREMAARRSAANSPSPTSPDLRGDGLRPPSTFTQGLSSPSPPPPSFRRPQPKSQASPTSDSTSSESSSDDNDSAGSSTLRPKRQGPTGTITPRSVGKGASELGHFNKPTPPQIRATPSAQSNSDQSSLYSRARASQSTSALMPNAAAQRASALYAAQSPDSSGIPHAKPQKAAADSDSDSTSSSDSDSDSDDAPLASRIIGHRRRGSGTSTATAATNVSRARMPPKPLIDISGLSPPSLPPLEMDRSPLHRPSPVELGGKAERDEHKETLRLPEAQEASKESEKEVASAHAKPSLNDRLARLAAGVSVARSNNLADPDELDKAQTDRGRSPGPMAHPKRSQTLPVDATVTERSVSPMPPTPSPIQSKPNGRSYSTPNAYDGIQDLSDPKPIVPTPIRERSPPPSFSVTSRPASQLSLASHINFGGIRSEHSPTSPPLTTAQARMMAARTPSPGNITPQPQTQSPTESRPQPLPRPDSRPQADSQASHSSQKPKHDDVSHPQPLISNHGMPPPKSFTAGGLLSTAESTETGRSSPASASSNSTAPSRARRRSQTIEHIPTLQPIVEPTAAPKPIRPRQFVSPNLPMSTSSESSQTSASTSGSAPLPRVAAPPAMTPAQQRARARTMEGQRDALASMPPVKPFAGCVRGYSPASSTGDSSSGRTPITPEDESEAGYARRERARAKPEGPRPGASAAARRGHRKSSSVTFAEAEGQRSRAAFAGREEKERADAAEEEEAAAEDRRRQRRRSEAKAALELGKIVNGRPPVDDDDDDDRPLDNMPPRMSMMNSMMGNSQTPMNMNMNMGMLSSPMSWSNPQSGMLSPQQFMIPPVPQNADPSLFAAHQQAMMYAKQAYQMAVAQQAMAAAEEEWERGSTVAASMINGGGGGGGGRMSTFGLGTPSMAQMGYGMNPMGMSPMGMNMGMQWPGMMGGFHSSAQSMYAGSVIGGGSELGTGARSQGWGTRSAYGDPSAGDRTSMLRGSAYGMQPPSMPPRAQSSGVVQTPQRPGPRPRTRTGPSGAGPKRDVPPLPPSSWKTGGRPA